MNANLITESTDIPVGELRQQLDYARVIGGDLLNHFSRNTEKGDDEPSERAATVQKLSMLLDFLFQAELWCNILEEQFIIFEKEEA